MNTKISRSGQALTAVILVAAFLLSACGSSANATPTISVDAIYTAAYQTFTAQQATQQALLPTDTPVPSPLPTLPPAPSPVPTFVVINSAGAPTSTSAASSIANGCNNSSYVSDVTIPDGTVMTPGQTFTKTWAIQNNGTCAWSTSYKLAFGLGDLMSGSATAITSPVQPNSQTQVSVNLVAPTNPGTYTGNWRMQDDKGQFFGTYLTVVIKVAGAAGTTAPTATPTDTATPTP